MSTADPPPVSAAAALRCAGARDQAPHGRAFAARQARAALRSRPAPRRHAPRRHAARRLAAAALLALLAACGATRERGYYAPAGAPPAGAPPSDTLAVQRQAGPDMVLDIACQGAYVNRVSGQLVATMHVQLDVTRPRAGDLRLRRDAVFVDVQLADGGPHLALRLTEAWSQRDVVAGDLVVPAWARRPFDLFFDSPLLVDQPPPAEILLRWEGEASGEQLIGQCLFERIPAGDQRLPSAAPMQDTAFGIRGGYYLPGVTSFGTRALRTSTEERQHYIFHDPEAWEW